MEPSWKAELQSKGMHADLIAFMTQEKITCAAQLANYIDTREEVMSLLVARVPATANDRNQKAVLTRLWREADQAENLRLTRQANGVEQDDWENPLPEQTRSSLMQRFVTKYSWRPSLRELLCEPLLGRMQRELDRKSFTVLSLDRIRTQRETSRTSAGKQLQVAQDVHLHFGSAGLPKAPREVGTNWLYVSLLEVLMLAWSIIGCFQDNGSSTLFASMQTCRDYLVYVKSKATPLSGSHPPLHLVRQADEETRSLWAEQMRNGSTFDQAVANMDSKQAALWLFANKQDVAEAQGSLPDFGTPPKEPKRRQSEDLSTPPPKRQNSDTSTCTHTKSGEEICGMYNDGKCVKKCRYQRLHVCNYKTKANVACGQPGHTKDFHSKTNRKPE